MFFFHSYWCWSYWCCDSWHLKRDKSFHLDPVFRFRRHVSVRIECKKIFIMHEDRVCEDLCNENLMHSKQNLHVANLSCRTIWNKHATGQKFGQPRSFFLIHRGRPGSFGLSRLWIFARLIVSSYHNNWKCAARKIFVDWIVSDCIYHRRKQRIQRLCRSSWSRIPPLPRTARVAPLNKTLP